MLLFLSFPAHAQRVASLNLCTDQYLLALAPERAVGVTFLALDPSLSALSDAAAAIPPLRADAEAVLATRPDLVLAGPWGARATLAALERRGVRVERLAPPEDFAAIRTATRGGMDDAIRKMAQPRAVDGDHAPARGAQAGVYADDLHACSLAVSSWQ